MKISKNTNLTRTLLLCIVILTSTLLVSAAVRNSAADTEGGGSGSGFVPTPATFSNYELAGNPFVTGYGVGITCPNSGGSCNNTEAEPAIRADPSGNFVGSSENVFCVIGGLCGGTFAYRSTDGGSHFKTLPLPNSVSAGRPGISPAGGDTDIAVAPRKNTSGQYNIYVSSLQSHPPLINVFVSTSSDGGNSWSINPTSASIPVDDREWIAADGASKVCISYHASATTNDIILDCSYNAGLVFTQHASTIEPTKAGFLAAFNNVIGNLAIDSNNHVIYQSFAATKDLPDAIACGASCHTHTVWLGVSIDGGNTFTDYMVYNNPNVNVDYGHQFINVSVDRAGNVYVLYNDDHNLFYSFSRTFGQTWFGPFQVNNTPSNTAIFPWSSAGNAGQLDVVWYGTSYYDGVRHPDTYPTGASWYVYFAQNLNALTPNSPFTQVAATAVIHHGGVCEAGVTCTGNRDLLDDLGVAASPTTGKAVIIYTSDQYVGTVAEPAQNKGSRGGCTASATDTVDCSHTDIAVQTGGSTVNQKKNHFEVDDEDFEETHLGDSNGGLHEPHFEFQVTNDGTVAINSITVDAGGLPWTVAWADSYPLLPGATNTATSKTIPLGLALTIGGVYAITLTATLADGTTESYSTNVIYTLGAGLGL